MGRKKRFTEDEIAYGIAHGCDPKREFKKPVIVAFCTSTACADKFKPFDDKKRNGREFARGKQKHGVKKSAVECPDCDMILVWRRLRANEINEGQNVNA